MLKFGFQIKEHVIRKVFSKKVKYPGKSHLEVRYDNKTGKKISPERVWDIEPSEAIKWDICGEKISEFIGHNDPPDCGAEHYFDSFDVVHEAAFILSKKLNCNVDSVNGIFDFYINPPGNPKAYINLSEINKLNKKIFDLQKRIQKLGLEVGEPRIFTSTDD